MKRGRFQLFLILILVLFSFFLTNSCDDNHSEYQPLEINQGFAHFSLVYPHDWEVSHVDVTENVVAFMIIAPNLEKNGKATLSTAWTFAVIKPDSKTPDAEAALENNIYMYNIGSDFHILDRGTVNMGSGITALKYEFTHSNAVTSYHEVPTETLKAYHLFFDYNGLIWQIETHSNIDVLTRDWPHFEFMLKNFEIE